MIDLSIELFIFILKLKSGKRSCVIIKISNRIIIERKNPKNNPPNFQVEFFNDQQNIKNINCFSNEGDVWKKSNTKINNNILTIKFREPFKPRRGRINCSLNDNGKWRWFGTQFVIKKN